MNRITAFSNAAEFQEIFGITEHGNGVTSRKNKILLALFKSKSVWDYCKKHNDWRLLACKSMGDMQHLLMLRITSESRRASRMYSGQNYVCMLCDHFFSSPIYSIDDSEGICVDGSSAEKGFIRYINEERGHKAYKMAAGKFFRHLILNTEIGCAIPQQVQVWILEKLVEEWRSFVAERYPELTLHVDDDFKKIYDEDWLRGDFGSCMVGEGNHTFYKDAVDANAAYLTDDDDMVVARCIIFTNVTDEDDKVWRLAERQYSSDCDDFLKRCLVDALIKGGHIDGYKQVGAGCGDARNFVDCEGNSLRDKRFKTPCYLEHDDTLSYQDSFKSYSFKLKMAYNYWPRDYHRDCGHIDNLDVTCGYYEGGCEYDHYHDRYVDEVIEVVYHGSYITCDRDDLADFVEFDGYYRHTDDVIECPVCGEYFLNEEYYFRDNGIHSELTGEVYCCQSCLERGEEDYKDEYWFYSDIDGDYVENEEDLSTCLLWSEWRNRYIVGHVITANISHHLKVGNLFIHNGVLADNIDRMLQDDIVCEELVEQSKTA